MVHTQHTRAQKRSVTRESHVRMSRRVMLCSSSDERAASGIGLLSSARVLVASVVPLFQSVPSPSLRPHPCRGLY